MTEQKFSLPYTIAFCIARDRVLMLHRKFPPNANRWNGVGGKIEPGETPDEAIAREIMEETGLDVAYAQALRYVGIVTWTLVRDQADINKGMYAYIVDFGAGDFEWGSRETDEGTLEWKPLAWVIDPENEQVVENIPHFLPIMLQSSQPMWYRCQYRDGNLENMQCLSITQQA